MSRDYKTSAEDILKSIKKIQTYIQNYSKDKFIHDDKTFDAVIRNLTIIGEAVKNIPDSIREKYSYIPWRKIAGLKDILTHEYFGIDEDIIWDVVTNRLNELIEPLEMLLKD